MGTIFYNADEVFEMAIQIERNGEKFYAISAERSSEPKAKEMLEKLRDMEADHQKIFASLREKISDQSAEPFVFDPDGQIGMYLRAAADSHIFNVNRDPGDMVKKDAPAKEIMDTAIHFEKDSIVYFLGMQDMVPEKLGKSEIGKLVEKEKKHILFIRETMGPLVRDQK